jgi:hypothetical protein
MPDLDRPASARKSTRPPVAKIAKCCSTCGGENIVVDAWAEWNVETQRWELGATFDHSVCEDCDGETRIVDKPL